MPKFIELDNKGMETWADESSGHLQVHYRQDVEPILELAKHERINGLADKGIKKDWWLYARIPPVVVLKLRFEYGIDIFDKNHTKRAVEIINRDFPYVKTTEKTHNLAH